MPRTNQLREEFSAINNKRAKELAQRLPITVDKIQSVFDEEEMAEISSLLTQLKSATNRAAREAAIVENVNSVIKLLKKGFGIVF
jgi:uncharacterized phage infection (PIP) family protein YhgE